MAEPPSPPSVVEKTMSMSRGEFERSMRALDPAFSPDIEPWLLTAEGGRVSISFTPLEPAVLGGALALPRARVTLRFEGLDRAAERAFLSRFEIAFQRGGG